MRKWLKRLGYVVAGLACLFLFSWFAAFAYLNSPPGERRLRAAIAQNVSKAIRGQVTVRDVDVAGSTVILHDLVLRDSQGKSVASVRRLIAQLEPFALLGHALHVRWLELDHPSLNLVLTPQGLNLAGAQTREAKAAEPTPAARAQPGASPAGRKATTAARKALRPGSASRPYALKVDTLKIVDGDLAFTQDLPEKRRAYRVDGLQAIGTLDFRPGVELLFARLGLGGRIVAPVQGPLRLDLTADRQGGRQLLRLTLNAAGALVQMRGDAVGPDKRLQIDQLSLPPELAREVLPKYPLHRPLIASGTVQQHGRTVEGDLAARTGPSQTQLQGTVGLSARHPLDLTVRGRGLDASSLAPRAPASELAFEAHVVGQVPNLAHAQARFQLQTGPGSTVAGVTVSGFSIAGAVNDGALHIDALQGRVPGAGVQLAGDLSRRRLELRGTLAASDLSQTSRALGAFLPGPAVRGRGTVRFRVTGTLRAPRAELTGTFALLQRGTLQARGLTLSLSTQDARRLRSARGELRARSVEMGDRTLRDVRGRFALGEGAFSTQGSGGPFALTARAVQRAPSTYRLALLQVRLPEEQWRLAAPATLTLAPTFSVRGLRLVSGPQAIALSGSLARQRVNAEVRLERVALGRLPTAWVAPRLPLAGTLSARGRIRGTLKQPDLGASLALDHGRVGRISPLFAQGRLTYSAERARGDLALRSPQASGQVSFDVPLADLRAGRAAPLRLAVHLQRLSLPEVASVLQREGQLGGALAGELRLGGTTTDPALSLGVGGTDLKLAPDAPPISAHLMSHARSGGLWTRLDLRSANATGFISTLTPRLAELLRRLRAHALLGTPMIAQARVNGFPLAALGLRRDGQPVKGTLSLDLRGEGPLRAPVGRAQLALDDFGAGPMQPVGLRGQIAAEAHRVEGQLNVAREGRTLLAARAHVGLGPAELTDRRKRARAPLRLHAQVGPVRARDLRSARAQQLVSQGELKATVEGAIDLTGTLSDPSADVRAGLEHASVGNAPPARMQLRAHYAEGTLGLAVRAQSAHGGSLALDGTSRVNLSYAALREGVRFSLAPTRARLDLRRFDPSFLAGLFPTISTLGGQIDGSGWFEGDVQDPHLGGRIEWRNGVVSVDGLGAYQDVHLLASGRDRTLQVDDLTLHAVDGTGRLTAQANLGIPTRFTAQLETRNFPIVTNYLRHGNLTLQAELEGTYAERTLRARVRVPAQARFAFPPSRPSEVVSLSPPDGIVQVDSRRELDEAPPQPKLTVPPATRQPGLVADVLLEMPQGIALTGPGPNGHVSLSPDFEVRWAQELLLFGVARVDHGTVPVFGQHLAVLAGSRVRFAGPIRAGYMEVSSEASSEAGPRRAVVAGRQQPRGVRVRPFVPGAMNELEIYGLLATGHLSLSAQSRRGKPPSFVGSEEPTFIEQLLGSKVPLNLIGIEAGGAEFSISSLQISTYFSDRLLITYSSQLDADPAQGENQSAVALEYRLDPRWMVELRYGDAEVGAANLLWRQRF